MTVTIPAPLTSDEQAALVAKAKAQGVSVDSLLRTAVLNIIAPAPDSKPPISVEEFDKAFEEIADMIPPGIIRRVRSARGINCAARTADMTSARASPSSRCCGNTTPDTISKPPVTAPATIDTMLPALT